MSDPVIYAPCEHGWSGDFRTHPPVIGPVSMTANTPICQGKRRLGTLSEVEGWKLKAAAYNDPSDTLWFCSVSNQMWHNADEPPLDCARHTQAGCHTVRLVPEIEGTDD